MTLDEADKKVHPVETQWHYPVMIKYGFIPITKEAVGLVRSYEYTNPTGRLVRCTTGYSADTFEELDPTTRRIRNIGYHGGLEAHLKSTQ